LTTTIFVVHVIPLTED